MVIFECTNPNWKYKGILFSEGDLNDFNPGIKILDKFQAGIMAMIWTDEENIWHLKIRLKFISGNKQVFSKDFGKNSSCTEILQWFYASFPQKNKKWYKNESETIDDMIEIMKKSNMLESIIILEMDK